MLQSVIYSTFPTQMHTTGLGPCRSYAICGNSWKYPCHVSLVKVVPNSGIHNGLQQLERSSNRSAIVSGARDGLYQGRPDPSQPEAEDQQGSGFSDIRAVPEITAADKEVHRPATN